MSKKLLIVSPFFPPIESVATNRIISFVKYLTGYDITVISINDNGNELKRGRFEVFPNRYIDLTRVPNISFFKKATFKKRGNIILHKMKALYNRILLATSLDEYDGWRKAVIKYIRNIDIKEFDILITSFAPLSSHLIGLEIKQLHPKIVWVADMRDQMGSNIFFPKYYRKKLMHYEKLIVEDADCITGVSKPIVDEFDALSKDIGKSVDLLEIRNGFDFELDLTSKPENKIFTITYAGTFYGDRNPDNFLKVIENLLKDGVLNDICINFVGVIKPIKVPDILKDKVKFTERLANKETIDLMKKSDGLLLIHPTSEVKGVYTGKLFEYLGALRPIIALVDPDDVAAELIREAKSGFISDNNDMEGIKDSVMKCYMLYKGLERFNPDIKVIESCKRRYQVEKLKRYLDEKVSFGG